MGKVPASAAYALLAEMREVGVAAQVVALMEWDLLIFCVPQMEKPATVRCSSLAQI